MADVPFNDDFLKMLGRNSRKELCRYRDLLIIERARRKIRHLGLLGTNISDEKIVQLLESPSPDEAFRRRLFAFLSLGFLLFVVLLLHDIVYQRYDRIPSELMFIVAYALSLFVNHARILYFRQERMLFIEKMDFSGGFAYATVEHEEVNRRCAVVASSIFRMSKSAKAEILASLKTDSDKTIAIKKYEIDKRLGLVAETA